MKTLVKTAGVLLVGSGVVWVIAVVGGVLSHSPAFSTAGQIAGAMVFHAVCMVSGVWCLQRGASRPAAERPASV